MKNELVGKKALVTGASRGIGRAVALKLARLGASVAVNYLNAEEEARKVVDVIRSSGGQAMAVQADMSRPEAIDRAFRVVMTEFGGLDILVNNAGMAIFGPLEDISEADFDRLMDLNVKGVFFACQQAARTLADGGRIINISTAVTKMMLPNYALYAASKGAIEELTKSLAKELGPRGITVNAISPGPTDTELFRHGKTQEQIAQLAAMAAFKRLGTPEDIANAVALLVSDDAAWISGQDISANGGLVA